MDPNSVADRRDLMSDVEHSRWQLDGIVKARRRLLKRTAGSEWYPNGAEELTPINQMAQAERAMVQRLVGGEPRAQVVAASPDLDALAYSQTLALNKVAQQISLRRKFRRLVRDAIYGMGIARIGMVPSKYVSLRDIAPEIDEEGEVGVGRLTLDVVSLEAWVHDCLADTLENKRYCGHAYWVEAEDIGKFLPGVSEKDLAEDEKRWIDERGGEMAGAISRGAEGASEDPAIGKRYWLWDLWLPRENVIITTQVNGTGEFAHVRPWKSRPGGPYLFLQYQEVADQAMPKAVLADLAIVHDSLNSTFRKLIDQTREQKTILGFRPGHEDDAERILASGSRRAIQMRDPNAVREYAFNGPDQALLGMFLQTREIASIIGGNTDVLAGLGVQAPTAAQEGMVAQGADNALQSMEIDTAEFIVETFEAMRWYLYNEQVEPIPIVKEVEGTDFRIASEFSAGDAAESGARFDAFAMQIMPASVMYRSPQERLRLIIEWWQTVIVPGLQLGLIQQAPNLDYLNELGARYGDIPELRSLLRAMTPDEQEAALNGGGGGEGPKQSPVTTRNYVRHGAGGVSRQGNAMQAMQLMNSGAQQGGGE